MVSDRMQPYFLSYCYAVMINNVNKCYVMLIHSIQIVLPFFTFVLLCTSCRSYWKLLLYHAS